MQLNYRRGKLSQNKETEENTGARKCLNIINQSFKMSKTFKVFRTFKLKLNFHNYTAIYKISDLKKIKDLASHSRKHGVGGTKHEPITQ